MEDGGGQGWWNGGLKPVILDYIYVFIYILSLD